MKKAGNGPSLKGGGKSSYPASKQTKFPVGKSTAPGKAAPTQTSFRKGAPSGGK
jgi:hypothetical protein